MSIFTLVGYLFILLGLFLACAAEEIVVPAHDSAITYVGAGWSQRNVASRIRFAPRKCMFTNEGPSTSDSGDALSFSFNGTSLKLIMEPRPDHGAFAVTLDGVSQADRNYTAVPGCEVAYASPLLQPRRHTVIVTLLDDGSVKSRSLQPHSFIYDTGNMKRAETSETTSSAVKPTGNAVPDFDFAPKDTPGHLPRRVIGGIAFGVVISLTFVAYFLHRSYRRKHPLTVTVEMKPAKKKSKRVRKFEQSYFMTAPPPSQKKSKRRRRPSARGPPPAINLQLTPTPPLLTEGGAVEGIKHQPSVGSVSSAPQSVKAEGLTEDASTHETTDAADTVGRAI